MKRGRLQIRPGGHLERELDSLRMNWRWIERYDANKEWAVMLGEDSRRLGRTERWMVSKAALRSSKKKYVEGVGIRGEEGAIGDWGLEVASHCKRVNSLSISSRCGEKDGLEDVARSRPE